MAGDQSEAKQIKYFYEVTSNATCFGYDRGIKRQSLFSPFPAGSGNRGFGYGVRRRHIRKTTFIKPASENCKGL